MKPPFRAPIVVWGRAGCWQPPGEPTGHKAHSASLLWTRFSSSLKQAKVANLECAEPCDSLFVKPRDVTQISQTQGQGHPFQSCASKNKRPSSFTQCHMFLAISAGSQPLSVPGLRTAAMLFNASTGCAAQYSLLSSAQQICHLPAGSKGSQQRPSAHLHC